MFTDDRGRSFVFEQEGRNVWRSAFDGWLAEKARAQGVQLADGTLVAGCEENGKFVSVELRGKKNGTENAKYVLDCGGCVSVLKNRLTGGTGDYITTYQTFSDGKIDLPKSFCTSLSDLRISTPEQDLYLGRLRCSASSTLMPFSASIFAAVHPQGPAPATITSYISASMPPVF